MLFRSLKGLYVAGGGISGAIAAIRSAGMVGRVAVVGYDLMDSTREALLDGTMTVVLSIPLPKLAEETLGGMMRAVSGQNDGANYACVLPFEMYTRENV